MARVNQVSSWALGFALVLAMFVPESSQLKNLVKRDASYGVSTDTGTPMSSKEILDSQIVYLLDAIPKKIAGAITAVESDRAKQRFKRITQGWAIVTASWGDAYSYYLADNRTFSTVTQADFYLYGFIANYGVGFGFPLLLGLPKATLPCDSNDFTRLVDQYGLDNGVSNYMPFQTGADGASLSSRLAEFDLVVRTQINCVLAEGGQIEATEVSWALEELVSALTLRMDLEFLDPTPDPTLESLTEAYKYAY